jgi:hypothetical protein
MDFYQYAKIFYIIIVNIQAEPVFSFTMAFKNFSLLKIKIPPINADTTSIRKKIFLSVKSFQKLVITPASLPPMEVDKNQPPISSAVSLEGASFDTNDKPIGLKSSSLMVNTK